MRHSRNTVIATCSLALAATVQGITIPHLEQTVLQQTELGVRVPVTLGVMSRCPDALLCEAVFSDVVKQTSNKINLSLTFIGRINASDSEFGVTCMHGPEECAGNVQELCAVKYSPTTLEWWDFVQCQNSYGRYKVGTPEIAIGCAEQVGLKWVGGPIGDCAGDDGSGRGEEGVGLLQESVKHTASLGVSKSCTILISGKPICIHDETWKECEGGHTAEDFVRQIEDEYQRLNRDNNNQSAEHI